MSEENKIYCPFLIKDNFGTIASEFKSDDFYVEVKRPLFSNEGFKIKTHFNGSINGYSLGYLYDYDKDEGWTKGNQYNKDYRKEVLWDFGDGTKKVGYNVEHYYKKPGRYKISCTFFDINRRGYQNSFCLYVIVKEVLPTMLRFDKNYTKSSIFCSKIERIARMECLISDSVNKELNVFVKRTNGDVDKSYSAIKDDENYQLKKYWTTLRNEQLLYYRTNEVYSNWLKPSELFFPNYTKLYYTLSHDGKSYGFQFYQVIPYEHYDNYLDYIVTLNPNVDIRNKESIKTYKITTLSSEDKLPSDAIYCGMRGFTDIFYKNDIVNDSSDLSIFYDIENENITGELFSSSNYLNINPLGLTVNTKPNKLDSVKLAASGTHFLKEIEGGAKLNDKEKIYIDPYLEGSLYKGLDILCHIFPFCTYDNSDFTFVGGYYIPKDVIVGINNIKLDEDSEYGENSTATLEEQDDDTKWLHKLLLKLNNYIKLSVTATLNIDDETATLNDDVERVLRITQKPLLNINNINIPREKQVEVDVERLLNSYMIHPMFQETPIIRDFIKKYLNTFIQKTQNDSVNFIDNVANSRTCYLSNLLAQIKMMGDEVTEYEYTNLDGINDLKEFARLLSMNHSDLVGHTREEEWDITINKDNKGKNVGEVISLDTELYLENKNDYEVGEKDYYGKILKVKPQGGEEITVKYDGGVDLIVHDKYTNDTKMVNFRTYLSKNGTNVIKISEYQSDWGWNLLLPENFDILNKKIEEFENKQNNSNYSSSQKEYFVNEVKRLKQKKHDLIDGYYDFYLLNPKKNKYRIGNFLNDSEITQEIESVEGWESEWGIAHDILMKILTKNGLMISDRSLGDDYDGSNSWETVLINETRSFLKQEIETTIIVEEKVKEYNVNGIVTIKGKIFSEGSNELFVTMENGRIDYKDDFYLTKDDEILEINVEGNEINEVTKSFNLEGKRIDDGSELSITISGKIDNPTIKMIAKINYNPVILEGYLNESAVFSNNGEIYNKDNDEFDSNFDDDYVMPFKGTINANGYINGVGQNTASISFSNFTVDKKDETEVDKKDETENVYFSLTNPKVTFTVDDDGNIIHEGESLTIYGSFTKYLTIKRGTITVKVGGTVKEPTLKVISSDIDFYYDYPDLLSEYTIDDFLTLKSKTKDPSEEATFNPNDGELITKADLTVYPFDYYIGIIEDDEEFVLGEDENTIISIKKTKLPLNTFINDLSLTLKRDSKHDNEANVNGEDVTYTCTINGQYVIENYDGQIIDNETDFVTIDFNCNKNITVDRFGFIEDTITHEIEIERITNSPLSITFDLKGSVCESEASMDIICDKKPTCILINTFDLDEVFETRGLEDGFTSNDGKIILTGFGEVDKVGVRFTDALKQVITSVYPKPIETAEETEVVEENQKYLVIEAYNETIIDERVEIDDITGEETIIPQEIQKEIIFKQYFEVDDSSLTVDADGNILWSGITQDITYTDQYELVDVLSGSYIKINTTDFSISKLILKVDIKEYTYFNGNISLEDDEDKSSVESIQRNFRGYCDINVSGKGILRNEDSDVDLVLTYKPRIEVTNNKTNKDSFIYLLPYEETKTVKIDSDGNIIIDDGLPQVQIEIKHFDEDEVPSDDYDENGNLKESNTEIEDEYDEEGNLIPKPEAIDDGDFNYTLSGSLSMSGNVQNVRFKELLENLFTISVIDTSFALDDYYTWDNPNVSGGFNVQASGKIKKNDEDSLANITITNVDTKIGDCIIPIYYNDDVTFDVPKTIDINVKKTEEHIDYVFDGSITVTIVFESDEDSDNYGPDLIVNTSINTATFDDRNFTPTYESYYWDDNNTSYGQFSVASDGWKQGEVEDGELNLTVTPISVVFDDGTDVGKSIETLNKKIVLNGEETYASFTFNYEETTNNVDYYFTATVTITPTLIETTDTPTLIVTTNNVSFEITDRKFTIDKTCDWSDFTIDGVDETTNLVGGFNVKVENGVRGQENTFNITINGTTVDEQILSGTTDYDWIWKVQQNGDIIHNTPYIEGETIPFNLTNTDGTTLSGEILISGNVKDEDTLNVELKNAKLVTIKTVNIDSRYEWSSYITEVSEIETISGGFNIVGSWKSNQNTLQLTMEIDSDTKINGNAVSGEMSIPLVISSTNSSGIIIPPTDGFTSFELTDEEGNSFSGEIIVKGTVYDLLVSIRNIKYASTLEIYKEIDYDGNVISYNTRGLEDGFYMFYGCNNLTSFTSDLSSLTDGTYMFSNCSNLTTFTSDLSSLTIGEYMFAGCTNLTSFTSDLSSLTNGTSMFGNCRNLNTFTSDLSSLTNGRNMFFICTNLTSFTSDLSSLIDGTSMFESTKLSSFNVTDLSNLEKAENMFTSVLSFDSIKNIFNALKNNLNEFNLTLVANSNDISRLESELGVINGVKTINNITCTFTYRTIS